MGALTAVRAVIGVHTFLFLVHTFLLLTSSHTTG